MAKFGKSEIKKFLDTISYKKKLDPDAVSKLRQAFAIGCTVEEACFYAEIATSTYYRWIEKYPKLEKYVKEMGHRLGVKSKENVAKIIESGDVANAWRYLERTQPDLYAETLKNAHSGELNVNTDLHEEDAALKLEFRERFKQNVIKRVQEQKKNEANSQTKSKDGSQDAN